MRDHLSKRDLRRTRDELLELLFLRPLGRDASRVLGLAGGVEQAGRPDDAVAGFHQEVALEPRQLTQPRDQALIHLPRQLFDAALVDALVAPMGGIHLLLLTSCFRVGELESNSPAARRPDFASRRENLGASAASALGLRAHSP